MKYYTARLAGKFGEHVSVQCPKWLADCIIENAFVDRGAVAHLGGRRVVALMDGKTMLWHTLLGWCGKHPRRRLKTHASSRPC